MFLHPVDAGRGVLWGLFHQLLQAGGFDLHVANLGRGAMGFFGNRLQNPQAMRGWSGVELAGEHHVHIRKKMGARSGIF